jgi:hypothetical protein
VSTTGVDSTAYIEGGVAEAQMDSDLFYALAEVAVALAGFSGIAVVLRQGSPGRPSPAVGRVLWLLIADCLIVVLFSFVPVVLHKAGWNPGAIWATSNTAVGLLHLAVFGLLAPGMLRGFRRIGRESHAVFGVLAPAFYLSEFAVGVCQLLAAAGLVFSNGEAVYAVGLLAFLLYAAINFTFLVASRDAAFHEGDPVKPPSGDADED